MTTRPVRVVGSALLSSLLVSGCGGSDPVGIEAAQHRQASHMSTAPTSVQLEGVVVDSTWMGVADMAVHVHSNDGRLVGTAFSNARGVFVASVPAGTALVLSTDAGSCFVAPATDSSRIAMGTCLLADL